MDCNKNFGGRPKKNFMDKRTVRLNCRINYDTKQKLDYIKNKLNISTSDVIRNAIRSMFDDIISR